MNNSKENKSAYLQTKAMADHLGVEGYWLKRQIGEAFLEDLHVIKVNKTTYLWDVVLCENRIHAWSDPEAHQACIEERLSYLSGKRVD